MEASEFVLGLFSYSLRVALSIRTARGKLVRTRFAGHLRAFCHTSARVETGPACAAAARLR